MHIRDGAEAALFESQKGVITTLTKGCKTVEVVRDAGEIPPGCGSTVLTSTIGVHILVRVRTAVCFRALFPLIHREPQGLVDLDAEIAKCEKKLQLAQLNLDKVRKVEAQADYVETVPANVRLVNEDRVRRGSILCLPILESLILRAEENVRGGSCFVGAVEGDVCEAEINTYRMSAI